METFREIIHMFRVNVLILVAMLIWFLLQLAATIPEFKSVEMAALVFGAAGVIIGVGAGAVKDLLTPDPPLQVPAEIVRELAETNRLLSVDKKVLIAEAAARKAEAEARIAEATKSVPVVPKRDK